jgi:hypothetical protein
MPYKLNEVMIPEIIPHQTKINIAGSRLSGKKQITVIISH